MSLDDEILSEERLDESQELMLYNMSLRQTSQRAAGGREGTHVLLSRVEENPAYQKMIEQGLLECKVYGQGIGSSAAASLIVTLKGLRYCVLFADEIEPRRTYDSAGVRRVKEEPKPADVNDVNYAILTSGATRNSSAAKDAAMALTPEQVASFERLGAQIRDAHGKRARRSFSFPSAAKQFEWQSPSGEVWAYALADANGPIAQVVGVSGESKSLHVPAQIEGAVVVAIAAGAFSMNEIVEEVICPDGVELIGASAFRQCTNLKRLVLPASVAEFKASWISRCPNLEELVLPGSLERVGRDVFENPGLRKLVIGPCASEIEPGVFQGSHLEEIVVDDANPFIAVQDGALYTRDRSALLALVYPVRELVVASGCKTLAKKSCYGCEELEQVRLPDSLVEVGPFALAYTGIVRFEAPASLESIAEKAFIGCRNLREARLNNGLVSIGESAFEGSGLRALALPATIASLGKSMTRATAIVHSGPNCSLTIDSDCVDLFLDGVGGLYRRREDGAHLVQLIDGDVERYSVYDGAVAIDPYAFAYHDRIESVSVPASVRTIGKSAFRVCRNLRHIELPDTVESIGDEAFLDTNLEEFRVPAALRELGARALVTYGAHHGSGSPSLARIEVAPGNESFYVSCGMLCRRTSAGASVAIFANCEPHVEFPEEVTHVDDYAFCNARGIEYLGLNARLYTLGTNALSTRCLIRHIHVERSEPVEGRTSFDFIFPNTPGAIRGISLGLGGASWVNVQGLTEQLDLCIVSAHDFNAPGKPGNISAYAQAKLILERLDDPVMLTPSNATLLERVLRDNIEDICVDVALYDDRAVLDALITRGFVNADNLDGVIERVNALRDAASTAYLLEAKRQRFGSFDFDYDL